ncbi:MAG: HIT family protein [Candidatus Syntrophosphaera sp.]|nr:HIT family protein [Candidatus Syntrophosphaera sp.]
MECAFCRITADKYLAENEHFFAIKDINPFTPGHCLIISKRHARDFFELESAEMEALREISLELKALLDKEYGPDGYNLLMNCGRAASQSVFHFHLHFLPRHNRDGKFFGLLRRFIH